MSKAQFKVVSNLIFDWGASDQRMKFDFETGVLTSKLIIIFPDGRDGFYEIDLDGKVVVSWCDDV